MLSSLMHALTLLVLLGLARGALAVSGELAEGLVLWSIAVPNRYNLTEYHLASVCREKLLPG